MKNSHCVIFPDSLDLQNNSRKGPKEKIMPISRTVKSTRRGRHLTKVVESNGDQSLGYHPFKNTSVEKSGEGGALPAALLPNPTNLPPAPKRWLPLSGTPMVPPSIAQPFLDECLLFLLISSPAGCLLQRKSLSHMLP